MNLPFQVVPDPSPGTNKLHLDLSTANQPGEVERSVGLGATGHRRSEPDDDLVVLRVPVANVIRMVDMH